LLCRYVVANWQQRLPSQKTLVAVEWIDEFDRLGQKIHIALPHDEGELSAAFEPGLLVHHSPESPTDTFSAVRATG
jgi:hypothetical protein